MISPDEVKLEFLHHLKEVYEALEPYPEKKCINTLYTIAYIKEHAWQINTWRIIHWEHKMIPGAVYTKYKNVAQQIADTLNQENPSIQG